LPVVSGICARYRERTVFTRFVTPEKPEDRRGQWQGYFTKCQCATRGNLASGALDIVPELARYSPPALVVDKPAYSAFFGSRLRPPAGGAQGGAVVGARGGNEPFGV